MFDVVARFFTAVWSGMKTLADNPLTLAAVVIVFLIILFILNTRKVRLTPKMMATVGIAVAIGAVLDTLILYRLPQGGSVTLASALPIILLSYAYGPEVGMLAGFLQGMANLILGPYIIHPLQTLLDYPLPYMLLGTAGYFKNRFVGTGIAHLFRLAMHVLSGVIFFAAYAPDGMNEGFGLWMYSLGYNASFLVLEFAILTTILALLPWSRFLRAVRGQASQNGGDASIPR